MVPHETIDSLRRERNDAWNACAEAHSALLRLEADRDNAERERDEALAEVARLRALINTPTTNDFLSAIQLEAAHQVERWGVEHDRGKGPEHWYWLLAYLAGKALRAAIDGDVEKAKHHTISTAAVLLNWHRRISGEGDRFQPASDEVAARVDGGDR